MFKKVLSSIGLGGSSNATPEPASKTPVGIFSPFKDGSLNYIYNLLFCDDLELFRTGNKKPEGPWKIILAKNPDSSELHAIAGDENEESRTRTLAYMILREKGESVKPKILLGVIVEVGLEHGLDVLAAFPDGRVRYINQTEKMSIFEGAPPALEPKVKQLMIASQIVLDKLGPWDKERLAPPVNGTVRMSFLSSDGLHFGQGYLMQMQTDPTGGPVIAASLSLLQTVVELSIERDAQNKRDQVSH